MNPMAYFILAALLFGLWGGYEFRDARAEAERVAAVEAAVKQAKEDEAVSREQEIELRKSQQKTQVVYKTITKEVPKYVPVIQKSDSECNLSRGTVRLFNDPAAERVPETPGVDDPADTEPSTVTEARLIDYGFDVIEQYNQVKNQCNALIEWHEKTHNRERR